VQCFSSSVDSHLCFSAMNPVSRPVFVTFVRVQAHVPGDDEYRARFRCSFSANGWQALWYWTVVDSGDMTGFTVPMCTCPLTFGPGRSNPA
jgi:hypothetical protein